MTNRASACFAEFSGTFFLVLMMACSASHSEEYTGLSSTSVACTLMALVYSFAAISGAHLNPAVTLGAALAQKMPWHAAGPFMVFQICGGVAGGLCATWLLGHDSAAVSFGVRASYHIWQAVSIEALFVAMLVFVALNVFSLRNNPEDNSNHFYGLAVGLVIIAAGQASHRVSGALFNPAAALGLGLPTAVSASADEIRWELWAYLCGHALGSCCGAWLFRCTRPEDYSLSGAYMDTYVPKFFVKLVAEFIGCFFVVLTAGCNYFGVITGAAWSTAAAVTCMTYALADVSGAHLNPAVTLAAWLSHKANLTMSTALCYMLTQVAASILAALTCVVVLQHGTSKLAPKVPYTSRQACVLEFVFSGMLCLTVLSTHVASSGAVTALSRNYYFGVAVGAAVLGGMVAGHGVSGGFLNPALTFGLSAASSPKTEYTDFAVELMGFQMAGGAAGAAAFFASHMTEYAKATQKQPMLG